MNTSNREYVKFNGCLILADMPFDLLERSFVGEREDFTVDALAAMAFEIVLEGYEVLHGETEELITGEIKVTFILAKQYVYISMS